MYETGLGVGPDLKAAREWYRRAAGLEDIGVQFQAISQADPRVQELEDRLARVGRELSRLRTEGLRADEERLAHERNRDNLRATEQAFATQAAEIEELKRRLEEAKQESDRGESSASARILELQSQLSTHERDAATLRNALAELEREIEIGQAAIQEADDLQRELISSKEEANQLREELASQASRAEPKPSPEVPSPSIELIEPPTEARTRGLELVADLTPSSGELIVGRVIAPAGLLALMVDKSETAPDANGIFGRQPRAQDRTCS
jgi:hypothetical protein